MSRMILTGAALIAALPVALVAQQKTVALTGAPVAALDEPFTTISGVREVAPGKVVVADPRDGRLLMADLGANAFRDIGRKGGGPGEWQMPLSVLPGPGATTYIGDPMAGKVHVVGTDGKIGSTILPPGGDGDGPSPIGPAMNPRGVDAQGRLYFEGAPFIPGGGTLDSIPIVRFDPKTKKVDSLAWVPNAMKVDQSGSSGNMRVMIRSKPMAASDVWDVLPDGRVVIVRANPYRVDIVGLDKRVLRGTPVAYTPIKVTKGDRDAFRARSASGGVAVVRSVGGVSTSGPAPRGGAPTPPPIADSEFPETMPPFTGRNAVRIAPNGEIWVERTRSFRDTTPTYDIFSTAGRPVGRATLRPNSTVVGFGAGSVYVSRQDPEDDLRYLERYALR